MVDVPPGTTLDVVVCTYNNAVLLDEALAALGRQRDIECHRWSCLVVDNNCTDDTGRVVQDHIARGAIPRRGW